ncbi:unnamed protein product, partial [Rotaria sp. Silwood1]
MEKQKKMTTNNIDNKPSKGDDSNEDISCDRITINVPFVGKATQQFTREITKVAMKIKPNTQVIAIPRPPQAVRQFFKNKDDTPKDLQSNLIYEVNCTDCSATYIGKTVRQACQRLKEHGAPSNVPIAQNNQALKRSARIAANKKFQ